MIIKGQYTSAEIFTENIEDAALQWVEAQCDHPAFDSVKIVQMPDEIPVMSVRRIGLGHILIQTMWGLISDVPFPCIDFLLQLRRRILPCLIIKYVR